jgi:hypothetical protein
MKAGMAWAGKLAGMSILPVPRKAMSVGRPGMVMASSCPKEKHLTWHKTFQGKTLAAVELQKQQEFRGCYLGYAFYSSRGLQTADLGWRPHRTHSI